MDPRATGDSIYRQADLTSASSATLSFDYDNGLAGPKQIELQISDDGGASFTTLTTFSAGSNTGSGSYSVDISSYSASNTQIRFYFAGSSFGVQDLTVDNVEIQYTSVDNTGGSNAFSTVSVSSGITVDAINDDPINAGSLPTDISVTEDVLSNLDLSAIEFADPDANSGELTVTLATSTGGQLSLTNAAGITLGGTATSATVTGTLADLNIYFDTASNIQYQHATTHLNGDNADTVNISIVDNGNTGTGGGGSINLGTVNIDITAESDSAVITGDDTGAVQEDVSVVTDNISTSGVLNAADPDAGQSSFQAETINGTYGDLVINASGNWTYSADNTQAAIQQLDVTEFLTDTLTVSAFDGTTHDVVITINGSEDASVIGGTASGAVTEDGTLVASDTLTITDVDTNDNPISYNDVASTASSYGSFEMTGNTWTYTLDNANATVQALDTTESITDSYTFFATDGSSQTVTVTIHGTEDASVIGGTTTGDVTEDGTLVASDTLTITDVDTNDNPVSFNDMASTAGDNGFGNFVMSGNTWTYTLDNANASVQGLGAGDSLTDSYTFTTTDGKNQAVTITINGAEDAPVLTPPIIHYQFLRKAQAPSPRSIWQLQIQTTR